MPSCNLYLSEENYKRHLKVKDGGGKPSEIYAKGLREEEIKQDTNAKDMDIIKIQVGKTQFDTPVGDIERYELFSFYGKMIAQGTLQLQPEFNDYIDVIAQQLYMTRKGNYLFYEKIEKISQEIVCAYRVIEKDKPIVMTRMAPEIVQALEKGEEGTFLDI